MLINLVLSLFAVYLIIGLVAILFAVTFLGSIALNIHREEQRIKKGKS